MVGALLTLNIFVGGGVVGALELMSIMSKNGVSVEDIICKVLQRRSSKSIDVRRIVIQLIPTLAYAFSDIFQSSITYTTPHTILHFCIDHLLAGIRSGGSGSSSSGGGSGGVRAEAYTALGNLYRTMSNTNGSGSGGSGSGSGSNNYTRSTEISTAIMTAISDGFDSDNFCPEANDCLGNILSSSSVCRKLMSVDLVTRMFRGGLTVKLIDTLKTTIRFVPR